jgi:hypothetical protein
MIKFTPNDHFEPTTDNIFKELLSSSVHVRILVKIIPKCSIIISHNVNLHEWPKSKTCNGTKRNEISACNY